MYMYMVHVYWLVSVYMYMHVSCCVFLCTHACYNDLGSKNRVLLGVFQKKVILKNLGCPGIFREIKGNTPKCPGRQTSQVGMYAMQVLSLW